MRRLSAFPVWGWIALYYMAIFLVYRFLLFSYLSGILDRQLLGLGDTMALTAVLAAYLFLCAIPPFILGRKSYYHPVWRGIESFACYGAVALILGALFALIQDDDWSAWSGVSAGGAAWARIGSVVVLLAVFVAAAWWGSRTAPERRRRTGSKSRGKSRKKDAAS